MKTLKIGTGICFAATIIPTLVLGSTAPIELRLGSLASLVVGCSIGVKDILKQRAEWTKRRKKAQ
jgi:hypothetical protein